MPGTLIAAAVLLVLFVPGYLFQAGVREHNHIQAAERDVYAIAQAIAISTGFALVFYALLELIPGALDNVLQDPTDDGLSWGQLVALGILLLFSNLAGKKFGEIVARRREARLVPRTRAWWKKLPHWVLDRFLSPSDLDQDLDDAIRAAKEGPMYVRLVRQGEEDTIGLMDAQAAEASMSALGSGLALSVRWTRDEAGGWVRQVGTHVGKPGIVEVLTCSPAQAERPAWAAGLPTSPQTLE